MIYNNSYFRKELRQVYFENHTNTRKKLAFGVFLGFISVALHFIFVQFGESTLSNTFPHLIQTTFYATTFTYISVSFLIYVIYYFKNYDNLSFSEIRKNQWYLLVKMNYNPRHMFFTKIAAMLFSLLFIYSIGFFVTLLLTSLLKYPFVYSYLPALYLIGILDIITISVIGITISLFTTRAFLTRLFVLASFVLLYLLRIGTGYRDIITSPELLLKKGIVAAFSFINSPYYVLACIIIISCLIICYYRTKNIAKYYSLPSVSIYDELPEDVSIARYDERTDSFRLLKIKKTKLKK